ncbi:MAG: exodeoxyribonuclease V subunit gamma [Leptospirales bacterium]|nr:exodeoxyribonuclease V subunit gamma [Leptospirales bacterium]
MSVPKRSSFYFCNDLAVLAGKLDEHLRLTRQNRDPLLPLTILVPNRNVSRWLQMYLAESQGPTGVSANLQFRYLEDGLKHYITLLDAQKRSVRIVSRDETELFLLEILLSGEVAGHLGSFISSSTPRKTHQLASRLASLFQEYEYHRNQWTLEWNAGKFKKGTESEQGRLYAAVWSKIKEKDKRATSLAEYAQSVFADLNAAKAGALPSEEIFVFGVSQISSLHQSILFSLSDWLPVRYFMLDLTMTGGGEEWRITSKPAFKASNGFPHSWLEPQRHTLASMQAMRKATHDWYFLRHQPNGRAVLPSLQRAILKQPARKESFLLASEPTVRIFACPGLFREVETVYQSIMAEMANDPDLTLTDIAVLVPDMATYRPVLESVFEREVDADGRLKVPFSITDFSSSQTSVYAQGVEALFALLEGNLARSEMFRLFGNPCFQERRGVTGQAVAQWLELAESLGIHGGTAGRHSFRAGLKRLRLGFVMQDRFDSNGDVVSMADPFVDEGAVGIFSAVVGELESAIETVSKADLASLPGLLKGVFDLFLSVPESLPHEMRVRENLAGTMLRLEEFASKRIDFHILREIILEAVQGLSASKGEYLANGVTVSALQPMRPIPFKILYVLGMTEGKFPGRAAESDMDLRNLHPLPTDVSLPEANRLLLLEAMMSAREKLILTYNCRDLRRDAKFEMASCVREVVAFAEDYAGPIPIHVMPITASRTRMRSDVVRLAPADQAMSLLYTGSVSAELTQEIERRRSLASIAHSMSSSTGHRIRRISLRQLADYLAYPLDTVMRQIGNLYGDEAEDLSLKDREPVFATGRIFFRIGVEILRTFFASEDRSFQKLEQIAISIYRKHASLLRLPLPGFGDADLFPQLSRWYGAQEKWASLLTGNPFEPAHAAFTVFPHGFPEGVEIVADLDLMRQNPFKSECVVPVHSVHNRSFLAPFLFYQLLQCSGKAANFTVHQIPYGKSQPSYREMLMRSVSDPEEYLTQVTSDFLEAEDQFIPFELVEEMKQMDVPPEEYSALLQSRVDEPGQKHPWREELVALVAPRIDHSARAKVQQRFGTFLEMVREKK